MKMYEYELHWIATGKAETTIATDISAACRNLGYDAEKVMMSECYFFEKRID